MIILREDEVVDVDVEMPDSFIKDLATDLLDLDSNFYIISIRNNEWRLYYGEKSILTITTTVNSSNDDKIATVTDYSGNSKIFSLDDQESIQEYVISTASKIL